MPDGGSAIYGSDPIAGVINYITRDSFEKKRIEKMRRSNEKIIERRERRGESKKIRKMIKIERKNEKRE